MDRFFVIHYNELGLKKGNRDFFENRLCTNINAVLADCGGQKVQRMHGRLLLPLKADADTHEIKLRLAKVFGIAYFAEAWTCAQAVEKMEQMAWNLIEAHSFKSFRIDARRADKRFPHTSVEINQRVGAYVKERPARAWIWKMPELTCWIEVVDKHALIYVERLPGPGGLPVGTSGKVVVLLSGGIDSPVAAWKMIKRGCTAVFVHFHSFPVHEQGIAGKGEADCEASCRLSASIEDLSGSFCGGSASHHGGDAAETRVILYRRYMMRLAERDRAAREGARAGDRRQRGAGGVADDRKHRRHFARRSDADSSALDWR